MGNQIKVIANEAGGWQSERLWPRGMSPDGQEPVASADATAAAQSVGQIARDGPDTDAPLPDDAPLPGTPDFDVTYEAEDATLGGNATVDSGVGGAEEYVTLSEGFDGTDFARDFFNDGIISGGTQEASITFTIDVPEDAWYTLDFRFSNDTGEIVYRDLRIDGETLPGILTFEDQHAPDDWASTTDRIQLAAGTHEVTLTSGLDQTDPATANPGGTVLIDSLRVSGGVTPSDHISTRSLLMNNLTNMVAIHESAQEDPEDTSIFGPELAQLRHGANWGQNQIDSAQLWIKGTDDDGDPAYYGPQFDSDLYFDEKGIMNVDYGNYLPTDEELFVTIEKDYAMVPGQPLLVERYTFTNERDVGDGLTTWEIMNRLHLPGELAQRAVWDERRETFIVELEQEDGSGPLYLAFGAYQEADGQTITAEGVIEKDPTTLPPIGEEPDLLDPSGIAVEPESVDDFYGEGLGGEVVGEGEGLTLAMSNDIELFPTRPVNYYFYYTLADDLDALDAQVERALNPNDNTILNSPDFWFGYTEEAWRQKIQDRVDPGAGSRPIEDEALISAYERTLVTILQSQQPEFGSFVAATNPSYEFKAWPRDGAATAIGLDAAGLIDEAEAYWNWMASIEEDGDGDPLFENGTFYTNYSFWDADEPIDFVQPEWDAQGLFLLGVYKHVEKLRELGLDERATAFLNDPVMREALIDSAEFIENNIDPEKGFGPAEFSIWETFFAHNGFTQITYASGLQAAALLGDDLGISEERQQDYVGGAATIKAAIERPITDPDFPGLWNEEDGYFVWGVTEEGDVIERPNAALNLMWVTGLFDIDDPKVQSQIEYVLDNLSNNTYGIARYDSDNFYAQSPFSPGGAYESNVDETSWPQITSYMGMGKEFGSDLDWAYNSLEWTVSRYAKEFMPPGEGIDPSLREPLPSTMVEPVTGAWYVMNLLNYTDQFDPRLDPPADNGQGNGNGEEPKLSVQELVEIYEPQSMLYQAEQFADLVDGSSAQWNGPYIDPQPEEFVEAAAEKLTIYPRSILPADGESVMGTLADAQLWEALDEIGISLIHPIAFEQAGGVLGDEILPSIDGGFDRISLQIEPLIGTEDDVRELSRIAAENGALVAGDVIPLHTGLGYDFRLATMNFETYPGIFDMVEVPEDMWDMLPSVEGKWDVEVVTNEEIQPFIDAGVVPGRLEVLLGDPDAENFSGWATTGEVEGVDGADRRWLYAHLFKPEQPMINWMDPSYNGRLTQSGDIVRHVDMGVPINRLDALPFVGLGYREDSDTLQTFSTQLAINASNDLGFTHRKFDGWTWVELNVPAEDYGEYLEYGPDLAYDFITRAETVHPLLTEDARVLRVAHRNLLDNELPHSRLIHELQNHDEIAYQLIPLRSLETVEYGDETLTGEELGDRILDEMQEEAAGDGAPYNVLYRSAEDGVAATYASFIASALEIDPYAATPEEVETIEQAHVLLAQVSAMQPGVFALSQWDLVGALPLDPSEVADRIEEGDFRWLNRGAVDLLDASDDTVSPFGLPEAQTLYAPLLQQLDDPASFASRVGDIIEARKQYGLASASVVAVPELEDDALFGLVMALPDEVGGVAITLANYGEDEASGAIDLSAIEGLPDISGESPRTIVEGQQFDGSFDGTMLNASLEGLSAQTIVIGGSAMELQDREAQPPDIPGEVDLEPVPFGPPGTESMVVADNEGGGNENDDERLTGGRGADVLVGGEEDDRLPAQQDDVDARLIDGGDEDDAIVENDAVAGLVIAASHAEQAITESDGTTAGPAWPEGSDDLLFEDEGGDVAAGRDGNAALAGKAGNDTLNGGPDSDTITGFEKGDLIIVEGLEVDRRSVLVDTTSGILSLDLDGGAVPDVVKTLEGNFGDGDFMVVPSEGSTEISFQPFLPALAEGTTVDQALVNGIINQKFLNGDHASAFEIELIDQGFAGYDNVLGAYEIAPDGTITDARILSANANLDVGGSVRIENLDPGHNVGFFIVQDAADALGMIGGIETLAFVDGEGGPASLSDGAGLSLLVNGAALDSPIWHSFSPELNADGLQHSLSGVDEGGEAIVIGFEDLAGGGDRDYEDVIFRVTAVEEPFT